MNLFKSSACLIGNNLNKFNLWRLLCILGIFTLVTKFFTCQSMVLYKKSIIVSGAPTEVFKFLADFSNLYMWDPACKTSTRIKGADEQIAVGDQYDIVMSVKNSITPYTFTVNKYDEVQMEVEWLGDSTHVSTVDAFSMEPVQGEPQMTRVNYEARISMKGILSIFSPFIKGMITDLGDAAMKGIEEECKNL